MTQYDCKMISMIIVKLIAKLINLKVIDGGQQNSNDFKTISSQGSDDRVDKSGICDGFQLWIMG